MVTVRGGEWMELATPDTFRAEPWLHPMAIELLERLVQREWSVMEHGSGGSTLWLAERVKRVYSIENDPTWHEAVQARAPKNVALILWSDPGLPTLPHSKFNLVLIDGVPSENRKCYLAVALKVTEPGGWVVLDNCNRPEYANERRLLQARCQHYITFMNHPGMFCNTEFYHLRDA